MWKPLFLIFRNKTQLDKAYNNSYKMLALTEKMFFETKKLLKENATTTEIDIYEADSRVNKYERKIRKKVMRDLLEIGSGDIYSGLLLASVVIDMERIGDECKNVLDLARNYNEKFDCKSYEEDIRKIEAAVADEFSRVRKQFEMLDKEDAEKMLAEYRWVNKLCDSGESDLIREKDKTVSANNAVALALYIRHLKRINAHLRNISTSVVNPFDKIGFNPRRTDTSR
jgi:phosphate uptake regulator